jgi:tRNA 2-selenouridine synthase
MSKALDITDFLAMSEGHLTIDVRSPKEYGKGHIPHAVNMPLFTDDERARVGTLYKQKSRNAAIEAGLEIVGPKMAEFVRFVKPLAKENKIFVHCWRGGMRSGSVAWLMDMMGYEVYTLKKGYKAYRTLVLESLALDVPYVILGGRTGSGKTQVLHTLRQKGEQIIDLERLANHKGSSFGALGELPQPTTEQFENDIYTVFARLDTTKPIWLEDESRNVGSCYIPHVLWDRMRCAPVVAIEIPFEVRVGRLVGDYGEADIEGLRDAIVRIERRLGHEAMKESIAALDAGDLADVARITLRYYDKAYDFGLTNRVSKDIRKFSFETDDMELIAERLIGAVKNTVA